MNAGRAGAVALGLVALAAAGFAWIRTPAHGPTGVEPSPADAPADAPASARTVAAVTDEDALDRRLAETRWIAVGGGAWPDSTQVQIEQDVGLAADVLGPGGVVLFGAGPGAPVVQVLHDRAPPSVMAALGDLFAPRSGRDARYRAPNLPVDAEATAARVLASIRSATVTGEDPLLLVLAGHGEIGETAQSNVIALWAGSTISATELAEVLDAARRPTRLVVTTCFSGGFGELAFVGAEATAGAPENERCGLFASPWDLEASGCDPNPDRSAQQGYALHFFNALRGRDREGRALPLTALDFDGDGEIGLLDAHTRVRIASDGIEVPTTTAERWLRARAPTHGRSDVDAGPAVEVATPEEDAVVAALSERMGAGSPPTEDDVAARLGVLEQQLAADEAAAEDARFAEEAASRTVAAQLLARWPVLDDPWHPDFAGLLAEHETSIAEFLAEAPGYADYLAAREDAARAHDRHADHTAEAAPIERLLRAMQTRRLAALLAAGDREAFAHWERLRACERWVPRTR